MAKATPAKLQPWIEAQRRHHLSDVQVQMARELGLNPQKFGKLDNHRQEPWKAPLPQFIEQLYYKRFKRPAPLAKAAHAVSTPLVSKDLTAAQRSAQIKDSSYPCIDTTTGSTCQKPRGQLVTMWQRD